MECNLLILLERTIIMNHRAMECRNRPVQGKCVLLVDDDIELLLLWQAFLEAHDYETCLAQNGAQALQVMHNRAVDAILCDLDMPELSGDLFYLEVARSWPQLLKRFIFVTGHAEIPTYEEFLKKAQATVLTKPVFIDCLLEKLQSVLGIQAQPAT